MEPDRLDLDEVMRSTIRRSRFALIRPAPHAMHSFDKQKSPTLDGSRAP
jgi:hypothetical protein